MSQIVLDSRITNGLLNLKNIPLDDNTEVKVIVIPKINLSKMSFENSQKITGRIKGNLSDDVIAERNNE
ncbi:hypothetical protein IIC38_19810 [candidate division KSB1 bacterium]|nr:hypothetical protein [candidate division KSB1 bacterium]